MKDIKEMQMDIQTYEPQKMNVRRCKLRTDMGFQHIYRVQSFTPHKGDIRVARFNNRGNLLATAGDDTVLKLWTVCGSSLDKSRWKKNSNNQNNNLKASPGKNNRNGHSPSIISKHKKTMSNNSTIEVEQEKSPPPGIIINQSPYRMYPGHVEQIFDLAWSDHDFIVTCGLDKMVILWHHKKESSLRKFQCGDIVTSVCFHPLVSSHFFATTIDYRCSLWDAQQRKVITFLETDHKAICTALTISPNGKYAVVGLLNGRCLFYEIPLQSSNEMDFVYYTAIECYSIEKKAKMVTGIQYIAIDKKHPHGAKEIKVTTKDSKIRIFDCTTFEMIAKYCGAHSEKDRTIRAMAADPHIICGSDHTSCRDR
eukprot:UN30692